MDEERNESISQTGKKASTVVVGVDGSAGAKEALRWALAEARLRKTPLRAVHAWMFGYSGGSVEGYPSWGGSLGAYTSLGLDLGDLHHAAEDLLERALADAGADAEGIEDRAPGRARLGRRGIDSRGQQGRSPGRRLSRARGLRRPSARVCQPAVRPSRSLPRRRRALAEANSGR